MGGTLAATRDKTITWQYPPQSDDILTLEFKFSSTDGGWVPLADVWPNDNSNVGAYILQTDSTGKTVVRFRRYRAGTLDWVNTYQWRVRKAKASSPVGFGKANSTEFGLVAPRRGQQTLTVTSSASGWSTVRAVGIYYQDQDGNHRLKFNLVGAFTAASLSGATITITGVTFKNVGGFRQPISAYNSSASINYVASAFTLANTGNVTVAHATATVDAHALSGDVELESRPTWA
jgi:hypothetical protein